MSSSCRSKRVLDSLAEEWSLGLGVKRAEQEKVAVEDSEEAEQNPRMGK